MDDRQDRPVPKALTSDPEQPLCCFLFFRIVPAVYDTPHTRTEVRAGDERPVVVRVALDDLGRATLEREADRLARARHPGVVEVLARHDDELTLAWAGAETLATARPSVTAAAGLLAAVASTVADLHGLGVVHGRLDPSHVVLDAAGHPRLCGLRGPDPDERVPGPADDVLALGELADHLLGPDAELEPIPDRRWGRRRWAGFHRRALQTLADRATDPDPARRPTAREFARAVAEAVPDAILLPPPEPAPPAPPPEPTPEPEVEVPIDAEPAEPLGDPVRDRSERFLGLRVEPARSRERADDPVEPRPRRVARPAPNPVRHSPRRLIAVASAVAVVVAVGAVVALRPDRRPGASPVAGPTSEAPGLVPSPTSSTTPPDCGATPVSSSADLDGDGCADPFRVEQTSVRALGRTYEVGRPGDHVQVADWDCDGRSTIGVVRPDTGEVFLFADWDVTDGPVTVRAVDVVDGARSLRPGTGPACVPVVEDDQGARTPLDLRGEGT